MKPTLAFCRSCKVSHEPGDHRAPKAVAPAKPAPKKKLPRKAYHRQYYDSCRRAKLGHKKRVPRRSVETPPDVETAAPPKTTA